MFVFKLWHPDVIDVNLLLQLCCGLKLRPEFVRILCVELKRWVPGEGLRWVFSMRQEGPLLLRLHDSYSSCSEAWIVSFLALCQVTEVSKQDRDVLPNSVLWLGLKVRVSQTPLVFISICLIYEHFLFLLLTVLFLRTSFIPFASLFWRWENLFYLEVAMWTWLGQSSFYLHPKHRSQGPVKCTLSSFHQTRSPGCSWLHQGHRTPSLLVWPWSRCRTTLGPRGTWQKQSVQACSCWESSSRLSSATENWRRVTFRSSCAFPHSLLGLSSVWFWFGFSEGQEPFFAFTVISVIILSLSLIAVYQPIDETCGHHFTLQVTFSSKRMLGPHLDALRGAHPLRDFIYDMPLLTETYKLNFQLLSF